MRLEREGEKEGRIESGRRGDSRHLIAIIIFEGRPLTESAKSEIRKRTSHLHFSSLELKRVNNII